MKTLTLAAMMAACAALPAAADIMAMKPFAFATTPTQKAAAAFIPVMSTEEEDRLISAASDVAKRVEIHTHIHEDGVMKMREVEGPLPLSPETPIKMAPGGVHVMLMGLNDPLAAGDSFEVTLSFETSGDISVTVPVVARGEAPAKGHGHGHSSD